MLCFFFTLDSLAQPQLERAKQDIGWVETGINRGSVADKANRLVQAPLGSPYCASYVSLVLHESKAQNPFVRSASSRAFITNESISVAAVIYKRAKVNPGDLVIWTRGGERSGLGHIGFVDSIAYDGYNTRFTTIEANTSSGQAGSQWNGSGIYKRRRHFTPLAAFRVTHFTPVRY